MLERDVDPSHQVQIGPYLVDFQTRQVTKPDGSTAEFSPTQLRLFSCLELGNYVQTPDLQRRMSVQNAFEKAQKDEALWVFLEKEPKTFVSDEQIGFLIHQIRDILGKDAILSKRGHGYMLNPESR